jgi:hypothetical protein
MLPPFDDFGNLPAGIHPCSIDELVSRFGGGSEERETQIVELLHFIEAAKSTGVRRLMVNGSFVTGKLAPNDVDVVLLPGRRAGVDSVGLLNTVPQVATRGGDLLSGRSAIVRS